MTDGAVVWFLAANDKEWECEQWVADAGTKTTSYKVLEFHPNN